VSSLDWRWKISEAIERIRTRYEFIGRKTGAPFLALVYPPEAEGAVVKEWHTHCGALRPEIDVRTVNVLEVTQEVMLDIGVENIVSSLADPMPGSDPQAELGQLWITAAAEVVQASLTEPGTGSRWSALNVWQRCFRRPAPEM
jgi:hypothetical protein